MRPDTTLALSPKLLAVRRAFETWRRTRAVRSPIPAPLWALAVEHARTVGVHATARQLRVNYYALKQRVAASGGTDARAARPTPTFIEVVPAGGGSAGGTECVIDVADAHGATMRITLRSPTLPDLAALTQGVWRSRV
jgi:hypothetical protein